ncbi:MAG: phosphoglycerate dehydrogenase [Sandaracinus sp.]|nr:phosphoglycerate dehydrogenase [Sandaracinus sp.]MAQ16705.1 phosphoglycerate dehydrogenase [Sandaracinus sp.]
MTYKVLVSDKLADSGLEVLHKAEGVEVTVKTGLSEDELCAIIGEFHGLVIRSGTKVTAKVLDAAEELKAIGRAGIGVDNVDLAAASKKGVVVMNTPFGNAVTTAEHALSLLDALCRQIPDATASMKAGKWEKKKFMGREKWGKTLGLVGLGNIGKIVADRARGLHMRVIATDPVLSKDEAENLDVELVTFDELLGRADFVSIHAPLVSGTKHLFDAAAFGKMKPTALLVNAARGGIVDEQALAAALKDGKLAGAALDVFETEPPAADHPLFALDNVVLTPHLGASTHEAQERVGVEICEQMVEYLKHGKVTNGVNVPALGDDAAERVGPVIEVAQRLGALLGQLADKPREVRVTASGAIADLVSPLAREVLAAFLEKQTGESVNPLSALYEAKDRSIELVEVRAPDDERPNLRITVNDAEGIHTATGRRSRSGELRLVGLEGYPMDAVLKGHALVIHNDDKPGVIGAVGSVLGKAGVNVSRLQVGLDEETGRALMLWNVADAVPPTVLDEVTKLDHVQSVRLVTV